MRGRVPHHGWHVSLPLLRIDVEQSELLALPWLSHLPLPPPSTPFLLPRPPPMSANMTTMPVDRAYPCIAAVFLLTMSLHHPTSLAPCSCHAAPVALLSMLWRRLEPKAAGAMAAVVAGLCGQATTGSRWLACCFPLAARWPKLAVLLPLATSAAPPAGPTTSPACSAPEEKKGLAPK